MANNFIIVTSYPDKGSVHSPRTVGVASYTKQLLQGMLKVNQKSQITVLAERFAEQANYIEDGMQINRLWKRGSLGEILKIWIKLVRSHEKVIVLSFEAYMFGNLLLGFVALCLFSILRLFGKRVVVLMHQVPKELSFVGGVRKFITKIGIGALRTILNTFDKVIVFEEALRKRIGDNAVFVPHFVPELESIDQHKARQTLGLSKSKLIVLYFGYIAPYKGLEKLIDLWADDSNVQLIIAGGVNPNHRNNPAIMQYVSKILLQAKQKNIITTGFVSEEKIPFYYSACDAVVLPYVEFMSSSGPMSLAWGYGKPVIMSYTLRAYMESVDISESIHASGIDVGDIFYSSNKESLARVLRGLGSLKKKFEVMATHMQVARSLTYVSRNMNNVMMKESR